jgi:leucyl/phenylalanyl-tRNA--protein transferase
MKKTHVEYHGAPRNKCNPREGDLVFLMRTAPRAPIWLPEGSAPVFPPPSDFDDHGLVAGGGDLSPARLLAAYRAGIFPWYDEPPILWWSPHPRSVITRESLHLSRSFKRTLRTTSFRVTAGTVLGEVMAQCADREGGTWLTDEMQAAYLALQEEGHMQSYEVWEGEALVGGLYGVLIGGLFAAESKFHRRTDASKIALAAAVADLFDRGVTLFDVQFTTDHLRSLGVHEVPRDEYLARLKMAVGVSLSAAVPGRVDLLPRVRALLAVR